MANQSQITSGYTLTGNTGMKGFLGSIGASGGMSMSNLYEARFEVIPDALKAALKDAGFSDLSTTGGAYSALTAFCEEASLPGMMANTGQTTGVYMGEGQVNYAHTKSFTDLTLGWTCDANLLPLKFLNKWMTFIFGEDGADTDYNSGSFKANRVRYPDDYQCTLSIKKAERGATNTLGRVNGIYTLYHCFPYSIQSTPLSYGSSTLLKVSASFYYRRWDFSYNNVKDSS
jgi:hypothetical protein